jgi:hypothetical protein
LYSPCLVVPSLYHHVICLPYQPSCDDYHFEASVKTMTERNCIREDQIRQIPSKATAAPRRITIPYITCMNGITLISARTRETEFGQSASLFLWRLTLKAPVYSCITYLRVFSGQSLERRVTYSDGSNFSRTLITDRDSCSTAILTHFT